MSESISFEEFKNWLTQLIVKKNGEIPDYHDWVNIKQMLDNVEIPEETLSMQFIVSDKWNVDNDQDDGNFNISYGSPLEMFNSEWNLIVENIKNNYIIEELENERKYGQKKSS